MMISARFDERFLEILDLKEWGDGSTLSSKERMLCPGSPDTCSCILGTERQGQWQCTSLKGARWFIFYNELKKALAILQKAKRLDQEAMARSIEDYCQVGK